MAKDFKEKLHFAIAAKSDFGSDMESFSDRSDEEVLVAAKNYAGSKFVMKEKFRWINQ